MKIVCFLSFFLLCLGSKAQEKFIMLTVVPDQVPYKIIDEQRPSRLLMKEDSIPFFECLVLKVDTVNIKLKKEIEALHASHETKPAIFYPLNGSLKIDSLEIKVVWVFNLWGFNKKEKGIGNCFSDSVKQVISFSFRPASSFRSIVFSEVEIQDRRAGENYSLTLTIDPSP